MNQHKVKTQSTDQQRCFQQKRMDFAVKAVCHPRLLQACLASVLVLSGQQAHAADINLHETCGLFNAIRAANRDAKVAGCAAGNGADTIIMQEKTWAFARAWANGATLPVINGELVIEGNGSVLKRRSNAANNPFRFFYVKHGASLSLKNVTIKGGNLPGGAAYVEPGAALTIQDSVLSEHNSGAGSGGALDVRGDLTMSRSTISHNTSGFAGGAIVVSGKGTLLLENSTVSHNGTTGVTGGGAIFVKGSGHSAIVNSTISTNKALNGHGGGVYFSESYPGHLSIVSSTITNNTAGLSGGGVFQQANLFLSHTILSGNSAPLGREMASAGYLSANDYNLFGHSSDAGLAGVTLYGGDVIPDQSFEEIISPLAGFGGAMQVHTPLDGSAALAAGGIATDLPQLDQTDEQVLAGIPRTIGAVQGVAEPLVAGPEISPGDILVDGNQCSLHDAMSAALQDKAVAGCTAGTGAQDTLVLAPGSVHTLQQALPVINSGVNPQGGNQITINGNGATITADSQQVPGSFFRVAGSFSAPQSHTPILKLNRLRLSGAQNSAVNIAYGRAFVNQTSIMDSGTGISVRTDADLFLNQSTVSANRGAGVYITSNALAVIGNSTLTSNKLAGVSVNGLAQLEMTDSTVVMNGASGINLRSKNRTSTIQRSIIAGNGKRMKDIARREIAIGHSATRWQGSFNLVGHAGNTGYNGTELPTNNITPLLGIEDMIAPLANNGGPTQTHALLETSPAIGIAGSACSPSDQRGISRTHSAVCDAGAYHRGE